ncbi:MULTISPECIES: MobH family relaxase [Comamonadaceae]|uniref:Relaxase n=1 Tax=Alicycliphilus denitrificans (strain DSM 14773 / CIP 107495 / K601) TaxID=596154 RepID=F4G9U1_ALIDK|nr:MULTISPECIES: MobH family relaxase [Comamonadaceae]AEB85673.1 Relaxase [Alicycliphilus denitrificans K601]
MAPGTSSSSTGVQPFASSDPGFEALPLAAVIAGHQALLGRIKLCFGADRATFERELMPLVQGYARFVHLLPATPDNYFHTPGGLLQLGLETAFFSLQGTDAHIFSGRATISERRELEPRWRIATFIGGLCSELHRTLTHLIVTTADGEEWPAFLGGLTPWLEQRAADRYFVRWRANARESRGVGLFALTHVVPAEVLQMLGEGNSLVVPQLLASIAGVPQYREHNVLDELVRRSMALVIDRNLLASADRYGKPQYGSHLERYLVDALRRLAAGHSAWTPNRDKSRVWLGPEGLFLVWPGAAEDALSLLESDQLVGIPKSPHTLLDLLLEAKVFVAASAGHETWDIQPPGAKTAIEAVKLANPAILLAGLDPQPTALTTNLLAPSSPPTKPPAQAANTKSAVAGDSPAATATAPSPPTTSPPEVSAAATPAEQLSLLEATGNTDAPETGQQEAPALVDAPASVPSGTEPSAIRLRAPMRLNPAVRKALADIVATLNDGASASNSCTVAEGVFVPLADFECRGIQPSIAIRALDDTRMIRHPQPGGPPTVSRQIRGTTVVGVILAPAHVEGLDPAAFGLAAEEQAATPSDSTAAQQRGR